MSDDMEKNLLENEGLVDNDNPIIEDTKGNETSESKKPSEKFNILTSKSKSRRMYIVLSAYSGLCLLTIFIAHESFKDKTDDSFEDHKTITIIIFILAVIVALGFSALVCVFEWLIKTHVLGILFVVILNGLTNYIITFSIHHGMNYEGFICALVVVFAGSIGMFAATFLAKEENVSIYYYFIFNGILSLLSGAFMMIFLNGTWQTIYMVLAFLISEFNVYSSQYQLVVFGNEKENEKKKKKDILMYSQPFELSLSAFKFLIFFVSLIFKAFKFCAKCCCSKDGKNNKK